MALPHRRRRLALGTTTVIACLAAVSFASAGRSDASSAVVVHSEDTGLCPFPLEVTVKTQNAGHQVGATALQFAFGGPSTITLRNGSTGRKATLSAPGGYSITPRTGTITFTGRHVWSWSTSKDVPFMSTQGTGSLVAPEYLLGGSSRAKVVDPCALVAAGAPSTKPRTTAAPWGLPRYPLSQIAYAGLTPLLGNLVRHDHVHLDVIVNGKNVPVPAGVGLADPKDTGACPQLPGSQSSGSQSSGAANETGDCDTKNIYVAQVANSPLHTHSASGIIHIEPDRPGVYTLGQFFDEWGVRLTSNCVGGYCSGEGKELRVYVQGKRVPGDPRSLVLGNRVEIAVVYGSPSAFASVPKAYTAGWPGLGCGGVHEPRC
jgi:hypothetical protein